MTPECPHEEVVVQAVLSGGWPEQASEELRVHAYSCSICCEVVNVAVMLRQDGERARREVQVPAAGQVWWRAAIRARMEQAQASTQPITWLHGITGACAVGVMLAVIGVAWPSIMRGASWVWEQMLTTSRGGTVEGVVSLAVSQSLIVGVVAAACLVLAPVVLYFALSDDKK